MTGTVAQALVMAMVMALALVMVMMMALVMVMVMVRAVRTLAGEPIAPRTSSLVLLERTHPR